MHSGICEMGLFNHILHGYPHACIEASACEATPENMDTYITSLNQELFTTTVKPLV